MSICSPTTAPSSTSLAFGLLSGDIFETRSYNSYDNGGIFHPYGSWFYTDWQIEKLNVSNLQGHDFTLTLLGSDCPYGGHAGYVYLDGFGGTLPPPTTPEPGTLALLGSGAIFAANWLRRRF
jgi:hypothetical protein